MNNYFLMSSELCKTQKAEFMKLSNREMQVLQLIGNELTTEQIAIYLSLSIPTIETHRRNLFKKTGVQSVVGLMKVAIKNNLIEFNNN